jgi:uncharacterized OB-fold protein
MVIQYWRNKDRYYRLMGVQCLKCNAEFFPPLYKCRKCGSEEIQDKEMPKEGKILTFTKLYETLPGFESQTPLCLAIVQLKNGVRVLGQIVDSPEDTVRIGSEVKAVFRRIKADGDSGQILYGYKFVVTDQST